MAGVKRELLDTVKARKLPYYGHTTRKQRELPGERDDARNNARCTQARKTTHGLDEQHQDVDRTVRGRVSQNGEGKRRGKGGEGKEGEQKGREEGKGKGREGQDRVTEDRDKWRKYVHGVANPRIEDG